MSWWGALPPGNAVCGELKHDLLFVEFRHVLGLTGMRLAQSSTAGTGVLGPGTDQRVWVGEGEGERLRVVSKMVSLRYVNLIKLGGLDPGGAGWRSVSNG